MKAYTSQSRFDERRKFTGVYQQMGRVHLDADWNEEVRIRTTDARRRTHDLAHGSPDDGFLITDEHLVSRIDGVQGWSGTGLEAGDLRVIPEVLRLDRREQEGLPRVVRASGHTGVFHQESTPLDLTAIGLEPSGSFSGAELVFSVRFERPTNDDDPTDVRFVLRDEGGNTASVAASFGQALPEQWHHQRIAVGDFAGVDLTRIVAWGVQGLPPRAHTWIDALRAIDANLGRDFVIRGGDGSIAGAGRMLVDGVRTVMERDTRYSNQADLPDPPELSGLPNDGTRAHVAYLDVWERLVTVQDDDFLHEPALDGLDTTVRMKLVTQVRVLQDVDPSARIELPSAIGGGRLTTNVPDGALPDRYPPDPEDPCRDRCLFTETAATGKGYTGSHNIHFRLEVLERPEWPRPVLLWARDNGSTRLALTADVPGGAKTVTVSPEDAARLRVGDVIVLSDNRIDLQPNGARRPVLRVVKGTRPDEGTVLFEEDTYELTTSPDGLLVGGPLGASESFAVQDHAYIRRWDRADWLLTDVRYNLPDGIVFRLAGTDWRSGDYWSFTARIHNPDGGSRGVVQQLTDAPVHGPVHRFVPLGRMTRTADAVVFEDLRPRFLPLNEVRERLRELVNERVPTGAFTLIIGDGVRTFGDIDQDLVEGVTGDEALQSAVKKLSDDGGTIYVRAGDYRLEKPVLLSRCSRLRVIGDGDASQLRVVGAGGAFIVDRCGSEGAVGIEHLSLVEAPREDSVIGEDAEDLPPPGEEVEPLKPGDLLGGTPSPSFSEELATHMATGLKGEKRAFNAVLSTLDRLRELQRQNPGVAVEDLPEAAELLTLLRALPHGVVTVSDSTSVTLSNLFVQSREPVPQAGGVLITGRCSIVRLAECRVEASSGVVATAFGPWLAQGFLARNPRSGLFLDEIALEGNRISARHGGEHGVYLSDGVLRGIRVRENVITGFGVGVAVRDRRFGRKANRNQVSVHRNRILESTGVGIDVDGQGVELLDNEVVNDEPKGLFQAAIRLAGSHHRVRGCTLALPRQASGGPVAIVAGVIVGGGAEVGSGIETPVHDVEIAGCSIQGAGGAYPSVGVLLGGPQPILDVRVRDCSFRELGDAAVRVWGHGGKVGRVRVDDNRIDDVATASVPAKTDIGPVLRQLSASVTDDLEAAGVDLTDPEALLAALVNNPSSSVVGPLDALLRWVSLRTLRGAIIFDQVVEGEVVSNRIRGVGHDATKGVHVRTAAISAIGGVDVSIEGNLVENVVADSQVLPPPDGGGASAKPVSWEVLKALGLVVEDERVDRQDVHAASVALRRMVLDYGRGDDPTRIQIGKKIYTAMDSLVTGLDGLGGQGSKIAASLVNEIDEMREAQGRDDHTIASNRVRATVSRAAAYTAGNESAQEAWEACRQYDLAVLDGPDALREAARRFQDVAQEIAKGLPERAEEIEFAMSKVLGDLETVNTVLDGARTLGVLGEWRDAHYERETVPPRGELFGTKRTIARQFAKNLDAEADRLSVEDDVQNREILDRLRPDKDALVDTIRKSDGYLADVVETDWRALERGVTVDRRDRMKGTLAALQDWTEGGSAGIAGDPTSHDVARMAEASDNFLVGMVARHLDDGIEKLSLETEGVKTKSLKVLQGATNQLRQLVADDPESSELAGQAHDAIRLAAQDPQKRTYELAKARTLLDGIKRRVGGVAPKPVAPVKPKVAPKYTDRRLAALAAVALSTPGLTGSLRSEGLELFRLHFARVLDLARFEGRQRSAALDVVGDAIDVLVDGGSSAASQSRAVHTLVSELDRVTTALSSQAPERTLAAAAVLIRATRQGLDTSEDEATRLLRVQAYLRERSANLSQSVHHSLAQRTTIADMQRGLHDALQRIALGEKPAVQELTPPVFTHLLAPADGVFAAGLGGRLRLCSNQIQHAVRGVTLEGASGHPLVGTPPADPSLVLQISGNRIDGCALGGMELQPSGTVSLTVNDNEVFASAGIAEAGPDGVGQSVARIEGTGDLVVQGNVFQSNGHRHERAILHELFVDWRGESVVRGNTIRHAGGGAGGAGLLLVAEEVASGLAMKLAAAPFLGIEPPPKPEEPETATSIAQKMPPFLATALRGVTPTLSTVDRLSSGHLVQKLSSTRIAPRMLTVSRTARPSPAAVDGAAKYLNREVKPPLSAILDFVKIRDYFKPLPPPPPPEQRTLHVEGNDISAFGPALLLVAEEEGDLVSTSVVGNGLHSDGGTGAAYVRYAESVVFATNRCQAPDAVNVVVIRSQAASVSVTGNVIAGAEPVTPPRPPVLPKPKPLPSTGQITLNLPIGGSAGLTVPIDPARLKGSLEAFTGTAQKAFAKVLTKRAEAEGPYVAPIELKEVARSSSSSTESADGGTATDGLEAVGSLEEPLRAEALSFDTRFATTSFSALLADAEPKYVLKPYDSPQEPDEVFRYITENNLGTKDTEAVIRGTELLEFQDSTTRDAFRTKIELYQKDKAIEELQQKTSVAGALEESAAASLFKREYDTKTTTAGALSTMTRLFAAQGFSTERTTAEVESLLDKSDGDAVKALDELQNGIFASDAATPEARKAIVDFGLIERVLAEGIFAGKDALAEPEEPEPEPEPPDPHEHSLVVFGGAAVAAVGNATTAGTLVVGAGDSVELNI